MKMIPLAEAIKLLQNCQAVIWGDSYLTYPEVNEDGPCFLRVKDNGYIVQFFIKDNPNVELVDKSMFLLDSNKETVQLNLLVYQQLQ